MSSSTRPFITPLFSVSTAKILNTDDTCDGGSGDVAHTEKVPHKQSLAAEHTQLAAAEHTQLAAVVHIQVEDDDKLPVGDRNVCVPCNRPVQLTASRLVRSF